MRSEWARLPHRCVNLVLALKVASPAGATYEGVRQALSLSTLSGARQMVRAARRLDLVEVVQTGVGPRAQALVVLSPKARRLLEEVFGDV